MFLSCCLRNIHIIYLYAQVDDYINMVLKADNNVGSTMEGEEEEGGSSISPRDIYFPFS